MTAFAFGTLPNVAKVQADRADQAGDSGESEEGYPPAARLTPEMVDHVVTVVMREINDFIGAKPPGGQRAIASKMFMAQPTLNRLLKKREGLGVDLLLALRAYLAQAGRPMTLDEILGLPPASSPAETSDAEKAMSDLVRRVAILEEMVRAVFAKGEMTPAEKKRVLDELARTRETAAGNRGARRKKRRSA